MGRSTLLDLLFDDPRVARCLVRADGRIARANAGWRLVAGPDLGGGSAELGRALDGEVIEIPRHARADRWFRTRLEPVVLDDGPGVLVTTEELADGRDVLGKLALEAGRLGGWQHDDATRLVNGDRRFCEIFGAPGPELPASALLDLVHPDDRERAEAAFLAGAAPAEYRVGERWVESHAVAVDGGRAGIVADVTDRRAAEERLRDEDRRKSEFLGVLSHELRNPLAPIRNSLYLLERAAPGSDTASRARQVLRRQVDHVTRLVDDLLDVTRISRGKVELKPVRVDLREVVRKLADDLAAMFAHAGVELVVRTSGPVWVDVDPTRMSQIAGNLLSNALKFTPDGGTVAVTVREAGGGAELSVRDTGVGIEPGEIERMFEPFTQADQGMARSKGGLGLGLALAKGLVDLHGGALSARSDGPGRGAEFVVRLPLAAREAAHPLPPEPAEVVARAILIIEDNADAGRTLVDLLTMRGHAVRLAADGRSGLALARETHPDVILCDIGLPDMPGYEVARAIREDAELRRTRLVALTGYARPEDQQRAVESGFDAHLAKPPPLEALEAALAG